MEKEYKNKLESFYSREKRMPTYTEMMTLFNFKSKNAVARVVDKLIDIGFVAKDHLGRLVPDSTFGEIPMLGSVKAGFPADVTEEMNDTLNLNEYLAPTKNANTYILEVDGDSMINAHIADGDLVLVEKTDKANDGDMVIANVDGEFTMKFFRKKGNLVWLEPANDDFKPIYPTQYLTINAIVKAVIRKY